MRVAGVCSSHTPLQEHGPARAGRFVSWVAACLVFGSVALYGQQAKPSEYDVKSAYLYNFSKFVEWPNPDPASKGGAFAICVLGTDPFGPALDAAIAGRTAGGVKTIARRISKPEDAIGCRILFISSSEDGRLSSIMTVLDHMGILTVSDINHFSERGWMIQFVSEGNHVRFEVNLKPVQDCGLNLSSELLKVAVAVRGKG